MELAEKILTWVEKVTNPNLLENLRNFSPNTPAINYGSNSNGTLTVFDETARMSWRRATKHFKVEDIGKVSVSEASSVFARQLVQQENVSILAPLSSVAAVSASKSDLNKHPSLHAFGKLSYDMHREEYKNLSEQEYFEYCINGGLKEGHTDFDIKLWAPSLRWCNSGGSHRFSTAYYIGVEQDYNYNIKGKLTIYSLNYDWLEQLNQEYKTFIMDVDNTADMLVLYDAFKINGYDSSSTFINLGSSPWERNECTTILLILNKKQQLPRIVRQWIQSHLQTGRIMPFSKITSNLKAVELNARQTISAIIQK